MVKNCQVASSCFKLGFFSQFLAASRAFFCFVYLDAGHFQSHSLSGYRVSRYLFVSNRGRLVAHLRYFDYRLATFSILVLFVMPNLLLSVSVEGVNDYNDECVSICRLRPVASVIQL